MPTHCNPDTPVRLSEPPVQLAPQVRPAIGGRPVPDPRPTPRSLSFTAPQVASPCEPPYNQWTYREHFAEPNPVPRYTRELSLPRKAQVVLPTTSQLQGQARMSRCLRKFLHCVETLGDSSAPYTVLHNSKAPEEHAARMHCKFSPSTLLLYLSCIATFLDFRQSDFELTQGELTVQSLADYMLSSQRSAVQDRAPHRTSLSQH